jgi:Phage tail assembly chaperone protein, TAC
VGDSFAASAQRLAGIAGAMLGWRPDEFWRATPAELACIIDALTPASAPAADGETLARLKEKFPDG